MKRKKRRERLERIRARMREREVERLVTITTHVMNVFQIRTVRKVLGKMIQALGEGLVESATEEPKNGK